MLQRRCVLNKTVAFRVAAEARRASPLVFFIWQYMDLVQYLWWSYGRPNVGSNRDGAPGLKSIPVSLNDKTEEVQSVQM
jgi:hypothetical protein